MVGPSCNLVVGKSDEHTKLGLSSLTQKFMHYNTFKVVVGRKKQNMKTESPALAEQRETRCHDEKESRDGPWIFFLLFCCRSKVLVRWFRLHRFASGVRPLISSLFTFLWLVFNVTSPSQLTFKSELSPYFRLVRRKEHTRFR